MYAVAIQGNVWGLGIYCIARVYYCAHILYSCLIFNSDT